MKIRPLGAQLFHADIQTGKHDEATRSFSNAPFKSLAVQRKSNI